MRSALFIAAGIAVAIAGQALASSQPTAGGSKMPGASSSTAPSSQTPPDTSSSSGSPSTPPDTGSSTSPTGSAADTSATAGGALSVGEPVKDNTGATIGAVSSLSAGANGQQMAVIKMGSDTFQVSADKLGTANGAATINMSQSQIAGMLHPAAGGR